MIDEFDKRLERARAHVQLEWDEDHTALVLVALGHKARRRRAVRAVAWVVSLVLLLCLVGVGTASFDSSFGSSFGSSSSSGLELSDGSMIEPSPDGRFTFEEVSEERVVIGLLEGEGFFDVTPRPKRSFIVDCGEIRVIVLGTAFHVRRERSRIQVRVERGMVRVERNGSEVTIGAGDSRWFPASSERRPQIQPNVESPSKEEGAAPPVHPKSLPVTRTGPPTGARPARRDFRTETKPKVEPPQDWQALADSGDFRAAYDAMPREPRDEPADLLLAADVSRLSGHPSEAVILLERIIAEHGEDPRAPLAAFTLGRILLPDQPKKAAEAFKRARLLDPSGALAEDAVVREAEACFRSGDRSKARALAEFYVSRYPAGRRRSELTPYLEPSEP